MHQKSRGGSCPFPEGFGNGRPNCPLPLALASFFAPIEGASIADRRGIVSLAQPIVSIVVLLVAVVVLRSAEFCEVDQTQDERLAITALAVVEQFVLPLIATLGPVDQDVFQFD